MNSFISTAKANRLFWLARYVERVFISLNAIRKYIDTDIDGATNAYREFCAITSIPNNYTDAKDFRKKILYDKNNSASIYSMLINAFDSGIGLREEVTAESVSCIDLALVIMGKCAAESSNI